MKRPLTADEHIDRAKRELAAGYPDSAQAHAIIALAETVIAWLWTPPAEPGPVVNWQGDDPCSS